MKIRLQGKGAVPGCGRRGEGAGKSRAAWQDSLHRGVEELPPLPRASGYGAPLSCFFSLKTKSLRSQGSGSGGMKYSTGHQKPQNKPRNESVTQPYTGGGATSFLLFLVRRQRFQIRLRARKDDCCPTPTSQVERAREIYLPLVR